MVYKPDPVNTLCLVTIHLDLLLPISSSDQPGLCLEIPSFAHESLLGLAPGGACRAFFVTKKAVSSYLTFSPLPNNQAVYFLWRFPSSCPGQLLAGTIFHEVRTFLSFKAAVTQPSANKAIYQKKVKFNRFKLNNFLKYHNSVTLIFLIYQSVNYLN